MYGLLIVIDLSDLNKSWRRLFRKKRSKLMQRINLKRLKNAVYFIPFKEPVPSQDEVNSFKKFWSLIRRFKVKANYFMATHVEPQNLVQTDTSKNGRRDPSRMKRYFALKPIKIPLE